MGPMRNMFESIAEAVSLMNNRMNELALDIRKALDGWENRLESHWSRVARCGWFPNWETSISIGSALSSGQSAIDAFMIREIEESWGASTGRILDLCPKRSHILKVAFGLHEEGNYIASIPLLLVQADGICADQIGTFLFTEKDNRTKSINKKVDESGDILLTALLNVLNVETQFSAGISKASDRRKQLGPNRSGILHGSKRHLDYGTKINSLKAFSLLAFVVFILLDSDSPLSARKS